MTRQSWLLALLYAAHGEPLSYPQINAAALFLRNRLSHEIEEDYYQFSPGILGVESRPSLWQDLQELVKKRCLYRLEDSASYVIGVVGAESIQKDFSALSPESKSVLQNIAECIFSASHLPMYRSVESIAWAEKRQVESMSVPLQDEVHA
jgi:hypothetical protein